MAQKTMGAILNEAADANERGMESSRRSALTNLQIKGQVADQNYQEEQRGRDREFYDGMKTAAQKHLFKDETVPGSSAITGAPGEIIQPSQMRRIPVDLSTSDGLKAISAFQQEVFQLRASQGRITGEEMGQLLNFRKALDQAGATQDFKAALSGDVEATARLGRIIGVSDTVKVLSGFDDVGLPQVFALTRSTKDGKVVEQRVPIGHLIAAVSPDVDAMLKSQTERVKAADDLRNTASTRTYQDRQGVAALQNADTARRNADSKAAKSTAAYQQYTVFRDAQKDEQYFIPGFTTQELGGKPQSIPDDSGRRLVDRFGRILIEEVGMTGGSSHNLAVGTIGEANTEATQRFSGIKNDITTAYNAIKAGNPATLGGRQIDPNNKAEVAALKDRYFELEESASAARLWQRVRDQIMENKIAQLKNPPQSTSGK